ncbi:DUF389 domain-containing protein [Nocardioides sp.]|uniref:DUF389 domain-containing protein n=1 Tax=Nocardioides sp. TaxID=35761 RepID=UPI001A2EB42C|nr:DUF389 domain-containing protein [Nocardioides sp.]MBJ7356600.1 DUF389 domain-containing protein [Nocardioides sp.]
MMHLRISVPADLSDAVLDLLADDPAISHLSHLPGASLQPTGDIVMADVAREAASDFVERLTALGLGERGTIHLEPVRSWVSKAGLQAERVTPGASADAVVWSDVTQRAYEDSELNWTYLWFMTLATLLAAIAIVVDSQVLVIGAMVLGPEFVPIAALGLAMVRRRRSLFRRAGTTLVTGFAVAIVMTTLLALVARAVGWVVAGDVTGPRPGTDFIYSPDKWSFIVALIAAAAGVLSLTSDKLGGLSGVFISVTTVPAAGNVALGLAFGAWGEVSGSLLQLALNISGMVLAGWLTLAVQELAWQGVRRRRRGQPSEG